MAKLGVMIEAQEGLNWDRWRRIVADAERLGFESLRVSDHCQSTSGMEKGETLQSWMALALAAEWTERIELATMVSPITFYQPGVLARMAVAVDQLSGGRLLLGVGAGWNEAEHRAFGIEFYDWKERFRRLEVGIELIEGLTSRIAGARKLPLLLGGSGERRALPLIARWATEWNAPFDLDVYRDKSQKLAAICSRIGRDPGQIRRSAMTSCVVGRSRDELLERASALSEVLPFLEGMSAGEALNALAARWPVGTGEEVAEQLRPLAAQGVELFFFQHFLLDDSDHLELWAKEVAPAIA